MVRSDLYADDHHWGDAVIDVDAWDLPALKARYLLDALPTRGRVLEIGCGSGRVLNTINHWRPDLSLDGCDIRPLAAPPAAFTFTCVEPSAGTLPYARGTFDAVVLFDVLEHAVDPAAMLAMTHDVLAPGGLLVSFTPLEDQPLSFYRLYRRWLGDDLYVGTKEHLHAFSEAALRSLVAARFTIRDITFAYHLLGHLMDATLFALVKLPLIRARFWDSNPYYRETSAAAVPSRSAFGVLLRVANAIAYWESRLLRRTALGAAGMLFTAIPR
ncbi:MAG TPA: class I SAM-dependent methyltransferase [Acidimicrobiia bacterium]